jgi:hypothetical protein
LIETFPWLLSPQWEKLTANQTIKKLVLEKHTPDVSNGGWHLDKREGGLKPDFIFLTDPGATRELVVFELKGPECGKTLQPVEYRQLVSYLDIIEGVYISNDITVKGVLVGHNKGGIRENDKRVEVMTWNDVWLQARKLHVSYLEALLVVSQPDADDARIKQIADFGGKETIELLRQLESLDEFPGVITEAMDLKKID